MGWDGGGCTTWSFIFPHKPSPTCFTTELCDWPATATWEWPGYILPLMHKPFTEKVLHHHRKIYWYLSKWIFLLQFSVLIPRSPFCCNIWLQKTSSRKKVSCRFHIQACRHFKAAILLLLNLLKEAVFPLVRHRKISEGGDQTLYSQYWFVFKCWNLKYLAYNCLLLFQIRNIL